MLVTGLGDPETNILTSTRWCNVIVSLLVTALIASNIIDHTRARPPPEKPRAEVACCHEEHVHGAWPVTVSLVVARTTLLGRVGRSVAETGREINGRRWWQSSVGR